MSYLIIISIFSVLCTFFTANKVSCAENNRQLRVSTINRSTSRIGYICPLLFMMLLFCLCAFRDSSIGNDTLNYIQIQNHLNKIGTIDSGLYMETGYQLFSLLVGKISKEDNAILIASALITYVLIFLCIKKRSANPLIAVCAFFALGFGMTMNIIRQGIAVSILFWAYAMVEDKKYVRAIVLTCIATAFHTVSIIMFIYIGLQFMKFNPRLVRIVTVTLLIFSFMGKGLISVLIKIFPQYSHYLTGERVGSGWLGIIFNLLILGSMAVIWYSYTTKEKRTNTTKWAYIFTAWILVLGFAINIFSRVSGAFLLLLIIPTINEIILSRKKSFYGLTWFVLVINAFFIVQNILRPEWNVIYPYCFFK